MADAQAERDARNAVAIANALRRQPGNVEYPDYEPKEDFTLWLAGYKEKVRNVFGFTQDQDDDVEEEVVRSISGKLKCGTALDTYLCLPVADKNDFARMVEALTKEFIDPREKRRFVENYAYNKRQKGQSLKDFMQEIIKDQNRYSGMRDDPAIPNVEKVRDGIRRFKNGIRTREGKKDKEQIRHLRYHLNDDEDLTWENTLKVAERWEGANDQDSSNSSSESSEEELVGAMAAKGKTKKKPANQDSMNLSLASLSLKVKANTEAIQEMKQNQKAIHSNLQSWKDETQSTLNQILAAIQGPAEENDEVHYFGHN